MPTGFKSELEAVRAWVSDQPEDALRPQILKILDRWRGHPAADLMWGKISKAATAGGQAPLGGREFVGLVIRLWIAATEIKRVTDGSPALERKARAQADRAFREDRVAEAALKKLGAIELEARRTRLLGRKQADAHLQNFKSRCSELFANNCGKPLDDVVATLTEVVFDCGPVSIDSVRGARKNRDIHGQK